MGSPTLFTPFTVGNVELANRIVIAPMCQYSGDADFIALARAMLFNPRWPWHAAAHLGARIRVPNQYFRSQPQQHPDLFAPAE